MKRKGIKARVVVSCNIFNSPYIFKLSRCFVLNIPQSFFDGLGIVLLRQSGVRIKLVSGVKFNLEPGDYLEMGGLIKLHFIISTLKRRCKSLIISCPCGEKWLTIEGWQVAEVNFTGNWGDFLIYSHFFVILEKILERAPIGGLFFNEYLKSNHFHE